MFQGCAHNSDEYKQVGFQSQEEVEPYMAHSRTTQFLANHLTKEEWNKFYDAFPDLRWERAFENSFNTVVTPNGPIVVPTGSPGPNPEHTAYAWRMFTMERKKKWDPETIRRLDARELVIGDDIFQIIYATGVPRFATNNNYGNLITILAYKPDLALLLREGKLESVHSCPGCWEYQSGMGLLGTLKGMSDYEVFDKLDLNEIKKKGLAGTQFYH